VSEFKTGFVALVGRPNVGKSTLLNHLLGQKISITSRKPQTTRHRILGVKTEPRWQIVYVDTPGIHDDQRDAMHRYLSKAASGALADVDVIVFVIEALNWRKEDDVVLARLKDSTAPVLLLINKIDKIKDKSRLLPFITEVQDKGEFKQVIPVSALKGENLTALEAELVKLIPESPALFPEEQVTDRSLRFLVAEIIREKLMRQLGQELPYSLAVEIERYEEKPNILHIGAVIWVSRTNQKAIVIGKGGQRIKEIGTQARTDIEKTVDKKVHLELWVKVKEGWADDERALRSLGYSDEY
jgi:GTP-binding protein Era